MNKAEKFGTELAEIEGNSIKIAVLPSNNTLAEVVASTSTSSGFSTCVFSAHVKYAIKILLPD